MMSMGEGIAKIKGAYDEVVPKLSPAIWGTMFPQPTGFIPLLVRMMRLMLSST